MFYALYNKQLHTYLTHPQIGLWHTSNLAEAEDMLSTCLEYVRTFDHDGYDRQFSIVSAETYEELCQSLLPDTV